MPTLRIIAVGEIPKKILKLIRKEQYFVLNRVAQKLKIKTPKKIIIKLYADKERMKVLTGYAGNAFADIEANTIHAYLPKERTSLGYHELVHIISKPFGKPPRMFSEGLALWFDKTWHGKSFLGIARSEYKAAFKKSTLHLYLDLAFNKLPQKYAYTVAGIVTQTLIAKRGLQSFLSAYKSSAMKKRGKEIERIFEKHFIVSPNQFLLEIIKKISKIE